MSMAHLECASWKDVFVKRALNSFREPFVFFYLNALKSTNLLTSICVCVCVSVRMCVCVRALEAKDRKVILWPQKKNDQPAQPGPNMFKSEFPVLLCVAFFPAYISFRLVSRPKKINLATNFKRNQNLYAIFFFIPLWLFICFTLCVH